MNGGRPKKLSKVSHKRSENYLFINSNHYLFIHLFLSLISAKRKAGVMARIIKEFWTGGSGIEECDVKMKEAAENIHKLKKEGRLLKLKHYDYRPKTFETKLAEAEAAHEIAKDKLCFANFRDRIRSTDFQVIVQKKVRKCLKRAAATPELCFSYKKKVQTAKFFRE